MKKKYISIIIAAMLMASINPMNVLAADNTGSEVVENAEVNNTFLNLESNMDKTYLNEKFTVDLNIDTTKEYYAAQIRIKYDNSKLSFLGFDKVDGIELVGYNDVNGEITFALASLGSENAMIGKSTLIKMNFKGISSGDALIDVTKSLVADGDVMERYLRDEECGETVVNILDKKFTFLDVTIIASHYGEDPKALLEKGIDADLNHDGNIDETDYKIAYELVLQNPDNDFEF